MGALRAVLILLGVATLAGCTAPAVSVAATPTDAPMSCTDVPAVMGIINIDWHTGVIIPSIDLGQLSADLSPYFGATPRYWIFGWGNRQYYMTSDPGILSGISALFPSRSVLLVRALSYKPTDRNMPGVKIWWLPLTASDRRHLDHYLTRYYYISSLGKLTDLGAGPYPHSAFFASTGTYDAFHTCNTWTVTALQKAGFPVSPQGVLFAGQVRADMHKLPFCD